MGRFRTNQRGVSILELLVSVSIFIVLALAATSLYSSVLQLNLKDRLTQDLQREGDAIQAHMSRNLKEAVELDGTSVLAGNQQKLAVKIKNNPPLCTAILTRTYGVNVSSQVFYTNEFGQTEILTQPSTTSTSLTFEPTPNATGTALKSVKIRGSLTRTKGTKTATYDLGSSISPRPQC